ncbi:hypothetical protein [Neobacillus citreus]|uniref:Uncharacterized protein n=1 Tax=Neobacillus citreus TaxID=2833578 RepID=A0A942TAC0_9BACI|nr:hypothetical protein [Neobacillus citreus]MCH6265086.1 hypothetical protein [Neobacillus citreus]
MGNAKGDKENYLNLYITLLVKGAIEDIISEKVEHLKWEHYFEGKKIDIFGQSIAGRFIFVENQISFASKEDRHLNSIAEIIEKAPHNSIVIWGATGFSEEIIKKIAKIIHEVKEKSIEFYAVEVNSCVIPLLEQLDNMHVLHVMDNLKLLNEVDVYNDIYDKYKSHCNDIDKEGEFKFDRITDRERTNAYIIKELRSRVKYPNIYREKRTLDINKIQYGLGRAGINLELVYNNRNGESYVSCQFTNQTEDLYQEMVKRKNIFENKIENEVECDNLNLKLVTFVKQFEHKFEKIDQLVELMNMYIFYLTNYTFYYGTAIQEQMWEKHKEGWLEN